VITYDELRDKTQKERVSIAAELYDRDDYANCERVLSIVLDADAHDSGAIAILGAMYTCQDRYGQAEMVFRYGTALYPKLKCMWTGLGTAIRNPERSDECISTLEYALEMEPNNTVALTNIASMYVEISDYEKAIEYAEKSLELRVDDKNAYAARDAIALASLGLEDFERGWKLNKESLAIKFRKEIVYGDEERWEGEKGKTVIIYGEQGLGDEIFYGSCIPDASEDCQVIIDCDERLEGLFQRSFPKATVYGTRRKAAPWLHSHNWDARCAAADLPGFYRNKIEDFPGTPFLKADPVRMEQWKNTFKSPKIGIAFRGGNKYTNRKLRTIPLETFRPLLDFGDLVSLEYSDFDYGDFPIEVYDFATMSKDYDNVAALVSQLDYVVTTCTSIVHLAGGLGIPCFVLRNKHYSWRYAHNMPWYDSVEIIHCDGDWSQGIEQVLSLIKERKVA
jgi:Tfp pilus assembly protein PilF